MDGGLGETDKQDAPPGVHNEDTEQGADAGGSQKFRATFERGHKVHGKYVVLEHIALGGSCSVFRGLEIGTNRLVALKVISKLNEDIEWQYQREIEALRSLQAPGVIKLLDILDDSEYVYICLEYCSGGTVHNYITARGERLPEPEVRHYFKQILHAVTYAHQNGWVHRDIKLDNILLVNDRDGQVVLCDWGFATTWDASKPQTRNCGTTHSLPPEMCKGDAYFGPECDVWSLGVVLYMMAVARIPFLGDNRRSTYQCIINGVYKQPSFLSDSLCHLISTMLETTVPSRATLSDVALHPWVTDSPFLGKRPTDLMWFEDTNTCSSEYETSLRTSDFEKFGLDHDRGHGSQTCTVISFSDRHSQLPSHKELPPADGEEKKGSIFLKHSSVGTNKIFESSHDEDVAEEKTGEEDEKNKKGKGKGKEKEKPELSEGKESTKEEEGEKKEGVEILVSRGSKGKEKAKRQSSNQTDSSGDGDEAGSDSNERSNDSSEEDVGEDQKERRHKNRGDKGKGREEKSKKPKRRKIRTESVESRVESLRRGEPKGLKLRRGAIDKEEISERSSSGPTPNFPNLYKNSSEEMGANFFTNLLTNEERPTRFSLSVGFGAELSGTPPPFDSRNPQSIEGAPSEGPVTVLEFLRTSSPQKKERPMSQLGFTSSKEHKKGKQAKRTKKKGGGVHDSADDAIFRDDSLFGSKSPKFLTRSSKTPTLSPGKSPKTPKTPKSPKTPKPSKSPFKEGKRKRRTMSRNKGSSNRGQSDDDALFKELEAADPQSFLLYSSSKKSFSKMPATPDQKKDKGERAQAGVREYATVQELPPPSRRSGSTQQESFYTYGSQPQPQHGSRPRRNSFTRAIGRERKNSKDEGVQLENNDPLIYALFRRFNFKKK